MHNDHLGTPQVITDAQQAVVWQAYYDPFGKATITTETITNNIRFPGQYYDQETGLYYNYFRYYDPTTGRYITSDPIGLAGGLNTYAYVGGNPVNAIDPYGLCDSGYAWKSNGMRGECVPESEAGYLPGNAASDAANICPIPIVKGAVIAGTLGRSIIANTTKSGIKLLGSPRTWKQKDLARVISKHGASTAGKGGLLKSRFFEGENIEQFILQGTHMSRVKQASGKNFQRVYDVGRNIGTDVTTGKSTSIMTVITQSSGRLVTAFPGTP